MKNVWIETVKILLLFHDSSIKYSWKLRERELKHTADRLAILFINVILYETLR
jgi:hypothetical protein